MNTETQDKYFTSLTPELRAEIIDRYKGFCKCDLSQSTPHINGARYLLEDLFGHDNLTGDISKTETTTPIPPNSGELKSEITKNKKKPKFKIGDKVRVVGEAYNGVIAEIVTVDEDDPIATYQIDDFEAWHAGVWFTDEDLEPYTEPETNRKNPQDLSLSEDQSTDNMEEKELNCKALYDALCDLESASIKVRKALISIQNEK